MSRPRKKPATPSRSVAKPKPIAAYVRVSTKDQKTDTQREEIRHWLEGNGIAPDKVEWYADVESGRKMSRPEFDRLQRDIFAGTVRTVVVFKVDRIARRLREGLNLLCDWCERGVRVVSVTQQVDVSGTLGRMVAALCSGWPRSSGSTVATARPPASSWPSAGELQRPQPGHDES